MSKIKNGGLDQYGAELFEQQKFGTSGIEGLEIFWVPPADPDEARILPEMVV